MKKIFSTILFVAFPVGFLAACNTGVVKSGPLKVTTKTFQTTTVTTVTTTTTPTVPSQTPAQSLLSPRTILLQPDTLCKEVGTFVAFAVRVTWETNAVYQWRFNDESIRNATNREFFIPQISVNDVGAYNVQVTWPSTGDSMVSSNAFLSVFSLWGTNSTGGTLTTSAQQFTYGSSFVCPGGATSCNRFYNPTTNSAVCYFYGPGFSPTSQSGPFINYGRNTHLTLSTAIAENRLSTPPYPIITSGVRLVDAAANPIDCAIGVTGAGLDQLLPNYALWTVTIYFNGTALPSSGRIALSWTYHSAAGEF
jgi:hypothetical protein